MRIKSIAVIFLITAVQLSGQQPPGIGSLIARYRLENAAISVAVADTENDTLLYGHNAGMSLTPASVQKLMTTATALMILGPDGQFKTTVVCNGKITPGGTLRGDIIIFGSGDPALGSPHFEHHYGDFIGSWVKATGRYGIKRIKGNIIAADTCYGDSPVNRRWFWEDIGNYWGAGSWGLTVNENSYTIFLKTGVEGSVPEVLGIYPEIPGLVLENRLTAAGNTDMGYVFHSPGTLDGWMEGTVPVERDTFRLRASIPDPPLVVADMLKKRLGASGIKVTGEAKSINRLPAHYDTDFHKITETLSPTYGDIVIVTNRESKNLFADNLLRQTGKAITGSSGFRESSEAVAGYLDTLGIGSGDIFMEDGSGLSQLNSVSSMAVSRLLVYMYHSEDSALFLSSLPEGGASGTLRNRFTDPFFAGRIFAKTGSSTRVRSLAGYIISESGRTLAFSIIVNNYNDAPSAVYSFMEKLVREIMINY